VSWRDDGEFRGLDFGVDLDHRDKEYGTMSLMTRAQRVTKKPEWVRSFVGAGRSRSGATSRRTGCWTRPTRPSRKKR
jgi:hypothetical protein